MNFRGIFYDEVINRDSHDRWKNLNRGLKPEFDIYDIKKLLAKGSQIFLC